MQYIHKKLNMPENVQKWIDKTKPSTWNLSQDNQDAYIELREQLRQEQNGLCCYCCEPLKAYATIEHVKCRDKYPKLTFSYENLLLSCQTLKQCDNAKGNQELPLTPLMIECDSEIKLNLAGELEGKTDRANQAINILNLNNRKLCDKRKRLIDIIFTAYDPKSINTPRQILTKDEINLLLEVVFNNSSDIHIQYILRKFEPIA